MKKEKGNTTGVSVLGLLGVLFVALKLIGIINWSWWWVTLPFWGVLGLIAAGIAFTFLAVGVAVLLAEMKVMYAEMKAKK